MKKKLLALALCLVLMIAPIASIGVFAGTTDGYTLDEGTKTYTVTTADGLLAVAAEINGGKNTYNITLAADIDLAGKTWTPIGTAEYIYSGTFDGGNFTISNLTLIRTLEDVKVAGYCSLIGKAYDGCTVKNVNFTGATVQGVEFNALVIGETAQKDANDLTKKVVVENVHIRNTDIKGSNGTGTSNGDKKEYTGALIGKAGASYTEINNCSVIATITSECRTSGLVGGESAPSDLTKTGMKISNCIVGGAITHAALEVGSNRLQDGGASGIMGYHSTIPLTVTNCAVFATLASTKAVGAISFNSNKLTVDASNFVATDYAFGKVNDVTLGETKLGNIFMYKPDATDATMAVAKNLNGKGDSPVKFNGADATWATATATVINSKDALKTRLAAIFGGNAVITTQVIEEFIGHDHAYTNEVVDAKYLKATATCTSAAIYYKSCSCGIFDSEITFTVGDPVAHTPADKWTTDENNHWHICASCLEVKSDEAAHTFGEWTVTKEATEARQGERTRACTVCEFEVTEKTDRLVKGADTTDNGKADADKDNDAKDKDSTSTSGCGSMVVGMSAALVVTLGMGVTVLKKRG